MSINITVDSTITHSGSVISAQLEDSVVLMNTETGAYYDIDPMGTEVWNKIESPQKISELCKELCEEFDVAPDKCQADIMQFMTEMSDLGAIEAV